MNILEAEDVVKGLPDQVLFQYAQNPPPNIPQYLAVSEVQRRQDMRQRFQSQQQGMEPSVKDQILQGGIASAGGPPEGMPMEGPPMEAPMGPPQEPPQGPPQGMPMFRGGITRMAGGGLTPGGIVYMQEGRQVPSTGSSFRAAPLRMSYPNVLSGQGDPVRELEMIRNMALINGDTETARAANRQLAALSREGMSIFNPVANARVVGQMANLAQDKSTGLGFVDPATSLIEPSETNATDRVVPSQREVDRILGKSPMERTPQENETLRAAGRTLTQRRQDPDGIVSRAESALASPFIRRAITDGAYRLSDEDLAAAGERTGAVNERIYRALGGRQYVEPAPAAPAAPASSVSPADVSAITAPASAGVQLPANFDFMAAQRSLNQGAAASGVPAGVTPGGIVNAETVGAASAATGSPQVPPAAPSSGSQLVSPTTPSFLQSLIDSLESPQRSPEVQAAIDLARDAAEKGLPPPVDLSQYVQSAQERQQTARDEARRMAIANALMGLGTGLVAGDPAAGLQRATQAATETLREGRREAQAEGRMAEQLQLQQAQQQRQAVIDAMKFKQESVNSIANLVSGEEKADRSAKLQVAQLLVSLQSDLNRTNAELRRAGISDERARGELRRVALQSATSLIESRMQSGELTEEMIQAAGGIGAMTNQLVNELLGATVGGSDFSEEMMVGDYSVRIRNQPQ